MTKKAKLYRLAGGGYVTRERGSRHLTPVLFYPHDGELEGGGVVIDPARLDHVHLLVKDELIRAELSAHSRKATTDR